jgi:membrane-bound metal-dependent hydrolase YbcI (DUF457 family)
MLGRTHALTGMVACSVLSATVWHPGHGQAVVAAVISGGAAVLPDIDHPDATVSRGFGFLTETFARLVSFAAGGHRHGTHSLAGIAVFTAVALAAEPWRQTVPGAIALTILLAVILASALRVLRLGGHGADLLALAAAAGMTWTGYGVTGLWWLAALGAASHIAGDMLTRSGCPLAWPLSPRRFWLLPARARLTTGHRAERFIITPALALALAWMAAGAAAGVHLPAPGTVPW